MGKFWCNYCGTKLTNDSPSVSKKHFYGRNHIRNAEIFWETVNAQYATNKVDRLDQTQQLRQAFHIPGLSSSLQDAAVEASLDKAELPLPKSYY